jgi:hypothetical protein
MVLVLLATYIFRVVKEEDVHNPKDGGSKPQVYKSTWCHVPQDM